MSIGNLLLWNWRMDKGLSALFSTDILENSRVEQIVGICGNGVLVDGCKCSREFREFLTNISSQLLRKYSDQCLEGGPSNSNSRLILQDLVNEIRTRLGFSVGPGYYGSPKYAS